MIYNEYRKMSITNLKFSLQILMKSGQNEGIFNGLLKTCNNTYNTDRTISYFNYIYHQSF